MMQKSQSLKVTAASQLKKEKTDTTKVVSSKQSSIVKQILDLVGQQNQDLYICLKDKKTGKIHQFSSNVPEFSLSKITSIVKAQKKNKTDVTQSLDALSERISDVATQVSQQETCQEPNESTTESKPSKTSKQEIPVLTEPENNQVVSKLETPKEFMEYDINQLKEAFFDQKAHYELGDHRIDSLLKPECLSSVNLHNEMSYAEPSNEDSAIFNFNSCE